jgi:hypothetical protein
MLKLLIIWFPFRFVGLSFRAFSIRRFVVIVQFITIIIFSLVRCFVSDILTFTMVALVVDFFIPVERIKSASTNQSVSKMGWSSQVLTLVRQLRLRQRL